MRPPTSQNVRSSPCTSANSSATSPTAGDAGVPCVKYNCNIIGILRTGRTLGRGGATYSHFDVRKWTDHSLTPLGQVTAEQLWDSALYVLDKIVPVAERANVKLAAH